MTEKAASRPAHGCVVAVVGFQLLVVLLALGLATSEYVRKGGITLIWSYARGERSFQGIDLGTANLHGATLAGADLSRARLGNLSGADLHGANLSEASLGDLHGADLREANLHGANLWGSDLSEADLRGANLSEAALERANLTNARLDDRTQMDAKWKLVWELTTAGGEGRDLRKANLAFANLAGANLSGANLSEAKLTNADLTGADLSGANVTSEQLAETILLEGAIMPDGTKWKCTAEEFFLCRTPTPLRAAKPVATSLPTSVPLTDGMVHVPAGTFLMGSADNDPEASSQERPQHPVYLDAFWIDRVEVTNAAYAQCVKAGACAVSHPSYSYSRDDYYGNPEFDNYPVVNVSWDDAQAYCRWVGGRLPTEAEWEKAARGVDGRTYPWGKQPPNCRRLNYTGPAGRCVGDTTAVGAYPTGASPYGALDMAGNVSEWVADWYDETYYSQWPTSNPSGPVSGLEHVIRGGSWGVTSRDVRTAHRFGYPGADVIIGFRCARSD